MMNEQEQPTGQIAVKLSVVEHLEKEINYLLARIERIRRLQKILKDNPEFADFYEQMQD